MKYVLLAVCALTFLISCQSDEVTNDISNSEYALMESNNVVMAEHPGVVPTDNELYIISLDPSTTWSTYDDFYQRVVVKGENLTYYDNLQWSCISEMVQFTSFLDEAPVDKKLFYLEEVFKRDYINEPRIATKLLGGAQSELTTEEFMNYAKSVYYINKKHLTAENWKKHLEKHGDTYHMLSFAGGE